MRVLLTSTALAAAATLLLTGTQRVPAAPVHAAELGTQSTAWSAADVDGVAPTKDVPDLHDLPTLHGVYVHPSDQPSRFGTYAAYFQNEQRRANGHLASATGHGFRWDERRAADGRLLHDITVVRAKANLRKLSGDTQFAEVGAALRAAGLTDPDKKYYVWLDATSSRACGEGQGLYDAQRGPANAAERSSYAVSYRPTGTTVYDANGGFCNPVLHETLHGLGAVAPHMPNVLPSSGHCDDDANDVMCSIRESPGGALDRTRPRTLDTGNDDYLDPAADLADTTGARLPWWTVTLSRFVCPRSAADRTVPDCSLPNTPAY